MARRTGKEQRQLGDDFEFRVVKAVRRKPSIVGLGSHDVIFANRTEGSRGEVDVVSMFTDSDGSPVFALIQAKRDGYVPVEERPKLERLMVLGSRASDFFRVFVSHYGSSNRWKCTRVRRMSDITSIPRATNNTTEAEILAETVERDRKDADFEMLVQNTIRSTSERNTVFGGLNPDFVAAQKTFVTTFRLEEEPGQPHITAFFEDTEKGPHASLVYCYRNGFIPKSEREEVSKIREVVEANQERLSMFVAFYATGKSWRPQRIVSQRDLEWFFYI